MSFGPAARPSTYRHSVAAETRIDCRRTTWSYLGYTVDGDWAYAASARLIKIDLVSLQMSKENPA